MDIIADRFTWEQLVHTGLVPGILKPAQIRPHSVLIGHPITEADLDAFTLRMVR